MSSSLLKGVLDRGIQVLFDTRGRELCSEAKRIVGVVADQDRGQFRIQARKGVVIATGGFEWNKKLVQAFLRGPMTAPVSVPECVVNRSARRFVNEAVNYNALGFALHNFNPDAYEFSNLPYWLIFDSRFISKYRMFTSRPGQSAPDWAKYADSMKNSAR